MQNQMQLFGSASFNTSHGSLMFRVYSSSDEANSELWSAVYTGIQI